MSTLRDLLTRPFRRPRRSTFGASTSLESRSAAAKQTTLLILNQRRTYEYYGGQAPSSDSIPVVMCLWNRRENLETSLRLLNAQAVSRPVRLVLWCNQPADADFYRKALSGFTFDGSLATAELHVSADNIRGIARFVAIRDIRKDGYRGPVITIDDDQEPGPNFITSLLETYTPKSLVGCWAWNSEVHDYGSRRQPAIGGSATYTGTGAAAFDSDLVDDPAFFKDIPETGIFIEDMWMTRLALHRGWRTERGDVDVAVRDDDRNQYSELIGLKMRFWSELQAVFPIEEPGWAAK